MSSHPRRVNHAERRPTRINHGSLSALPSAYTFSLRIGRRERTRHGLAAWEVGAYPKDFLPVRFKGLDHYLKNPWID